MNKKDVISLINKNPIFYLATLEDSYPRVRGMLLYKADETGIYFHTGSFKNVYKQIIKYSKSEVCFNCEGGTQIRISGEVTEVSDDNLRDEIIKHPSRGFLREWIDTGKFNYREFIVFKLVYNEATVWRMEKNFQESEIINMS
ncbi:pyridoxamine 5'-phosphate oxidase family protein [Clostridium cylindrosporum]|uniref:Pyridoxamine 5'-phosphate oxidase n=1 Tax=Clostridium cylindrosporum DSM 605 TaxID=1121307 RepID=A0A0J8G3R9_CLOCY|nr:pyridoxamine 5'-phosphate oxidase family protein [Clostridium cylindrosporum]KMT22356.1 pyridoxamine 5'-phosphate oxidase [Clostridium cylindrosporum DSM 605]